MKRWCAVLVLVGFVPCLATPALGSPGTPRWRFDYGMGLSGTTPIPALTSVTGIGTGSDGRIQLTFPDRVDEVTAVGEGSRSVAVAAPAAVASDGTTDYVAGAGTSGVKVYPDTGMTSTATWGAGRTASALAVTASDPLWNEEVVWVGDSPDTTITGYDTAGAQVTSFSSHTAHVTGLATLPDGTLLVLDGPAGIVQRLTSQGVPVGRFASTGAGDGQVSNPEGIATDSAGTVFVADTGNSRIDIYDAQGQYQAQFGTHASYPSGSVPTYEPGEFSSPRGVVVDCTGRLHVLDVAPSSGLDPNPEGRVAVFTGVAAPTGRCYGPASDGFTGPANAVVAVDRAGNTYLATSTKVSKFTAAGKLITSWSAPASGPGHWSSPTGITVSPAGEVYLVDGTTKKVLEFHAAGAFVRSWTGGGGFTPVSVVVRPSDGHVFVSYLAHDVEESTATGALVGTIKLAPLGPQDVLPWYLGMAGNTLLVTVQQQSYPAQTALERFDASDGYLDQIRGPGRTVEDDYLFGVAPYPGGGYAFDAIPSTGDLNGDPAEGGIVRVSASGTVLGRIAERELPSGTAPAGGLATDCLGRIIGANVVTGRVFRVLTASGVCRWLPVATTGATLARTSTSLSVRASVNPSAQVTRVRVQYGPTTSYGHQTGWITLPSDDVVLNRTLVLTGLAHAHTYHYRVQASNGSGTVSGRDATGRTS